MREREQLKDCFFPLPLPSYLITYVFGREIHKKKNSARLIY